MNLRLHHITLRFLLLVIPISMYWPAHSQLTIEWDKTAGAAGWEELNTLITTSDGGYLAGGITTSQSPSPGTELTHFTRDTVVFPDTTGDFWLVKLDANGKVLWDGMYGGYRQDRIWSAQETNDGGFILGGESYSGNDPGTEHTQFNRGRKDYWLLKIDSLGRFEKDWTFGGPGEDVLRVVIPTTNGFMLFGYSNSNNNTTTWGEKTDDSRGEEDFWIVKTDKDLTYLDDWTIGGSGRDWINDVKVLPDGNYIISGWSTSPVSGEKTTPHYGANDFWIVKIDPQVNILWQMTIGGNGEDVPNDLIVNPDGSIVVTGFSSSANSSENGIGNKTAPLYGNHDAYIVKIRDEGDKGVVVWQKTFGGNASAYLFSSVRTGAGNIMAAGYSASQDTFSGEGNKFAPIIGGIDYWIIYLDPMGNKLWDSSLGGLDNDTCNKIIKAHDTGFIFGGNSGSMMHPPYKSENARGGNDMWIVKTNCFLKPPGLEDSTTSCNNEILTINATVDSCDFCTYLWSDGSSGPIREFEPETHIDLQLIVQHPDGCWIEDSIEINVIPGIETAYSDFSPVTCYEANDAAFAIEEVVGGSAPFLFRLNEGEWLDMAVFTDMGPGDYFLEIVDTNGCTFDTAFYIEQPTEVLVELGQDIEISFGDSVQLQALTNLLPGEFTFTWGQPHLLSCNDCLTPWVQPLYTTTYSIALRDTMGCEKKDNVRVILNRETSVFIPNAFSPNNDNVNDFFTPYADQSVSRILRMHVYDRWGERLFERYNFQPNQDQLGWNGLQNGRFMQPGMFTYLIEVEYIDDRTEIFTGDLTLIR